MVQKGRLQAKSIKKQSREIAVVTIVLFVFLCVLINSSTRQLVYDNADEHTQITAIRMRDQIDLMFDKMKNFCISIGEDASVRNMMISSYSEMPGNIKVAIECLTSYKILESAIEDISLVNDTVHYSAVYSYERLDEIRREVDGASFLWLGVRHHEFAGASGKPGMLVYAGDIMEDGKNLGTVIISVSSSWLQTDKESGLNSSYFLADEEGVLYGFNCTTEAGEEIYRIWKENGGGEELRKKPFYIHSYYFEDMGCYLISALNTQNTGVGLSRIQMLVWGSVILAGFFCTAFFLIINRGVVNPLHQFSTAIRRIRELRQRSLQKELILDGCEEIRDIGKEFSGMMADIESLNKQIFRSATEFYELKVQKQEAELAYLRSQIDPHFLYNTLEVVRELAMVKGAGDVARIAVDMGKIFRYSTKGRGQVSLEEEMSIVKSYIRIQQMRFQGKIEVFYFISEEILKLKVIKMLLQPIVENAIFHGLEPKSGEGSLYIGAIREGEKLVVTVKDDGIGIPKEVLGGIRKSLTEERVDTSKHVGILNTNARLKLQYGRGYGLEVESHEGDGTTVTMTLPVQEGQ